MAYNNGPTIVRNGLVLSLDAADGFSYASNTLDVEYLIVAGGGSGGTSQTEHRGGGGGAGGVLLGKTTLSNVSNTVTVGGGGSSVLGVSRITGNNGSNSVFASLTAIGGGGGSGGSGSGGANSGGSGGGGHYTGGTTGGSGTVGQGNAGGNSVQSVGGAGGGGASEPGYSNAAGPKKQFGGDGIYINWLNEIGLGDGGYFGGGGGSGENPSYSGQGGLGGGGAGATTDTNNGSDGLANTGGGGGGTRNGNSGAGGSGIVIIRYRGPQRASGGTVTTTNGWTIHTFTASGTFTVGSHIGDLSGNGNSGQLIGDPTFSAESNGSLIMGLGKWIDLGNTLFLENNAPLSVSGWMKVNTLSSRDMLLCRNNALRAGSPYTWLFGIRDTGTLMGAYDGTTWRDVSFSFSTSIWYNLTFSYNGTTMSYYINGSLIGTQSFTFSDSTTGRNVQIGGYSGTTGDIIGSYGLVQFYNRALTAQEIQQNYNATKGRYGL
jgi:hypothetical protein